MRADTPTHVPAKEPEANILRRGWAASGIFSVGAKGWIRSRVLFKVRAAALEFGLGVSDSVGGKGVFLFAAMTKKRKNNGERSCMVLTMHIPITL